MAKAKVIVRAKPVKNGSGKLIARAPVAVTHTDRPKGPMIYGSTVKLMPHIKKNGRGKPRRN